MLTGGGGTDAVPRPADITIKEQNNKAVIVIIFFISNSDY
jgi:hypothetical protein